MSQYTLPFQQKEDLPEEDFRLFAQLNASPKHWSNDWQHLCYYDDKSAFYLLKDEILKQYGTTDGYDMQVINRQCRHCDGTGRHCYYIKHLAETCWQCNGTGIYEKVQIALRRYVLNGIVFHKPVGQISGRAIHTRETTIELDFHNVIKGIVVHKPALGLNYMEAFRQLCQKYSPAMFDRFFPLKTREELVL